MKRTAKKLTVLTISRGSVFNRSDTNRQLHRPVSRIRLENTAI